MSQWAFSQREKQIPFLVFIFCVPVLLQLGPLQPVPMALCHVPAPDAPHRSPARGSLVGPVSVACPQLGDASRSWLPFPVQCQDLQGGAGRSVGSPGPKSPSLLGCAPAHREKPKGALCSSPIHSRWHSPTVPGPSLLPTFATLLVAPPRQVPPTVGHTNQGQAPEEGEIRTQSLCQGNRNLFPCP